jgi:hypothetical protein
VELFGQSSVLDLVNQAKFPYFEPISRTVPHQFDKVLFSSLVKTEADKPDLSALRIARETVDTPREKKFPWNVVVPVAAIVIVAVLYLLFRGNFAKAPEVEVATASLTFPSQANAVLTASGYVVAQQKAAVASKVTV